MHRTVPLLLLGLLAGCAVPPQGRTPFLPTKGMLAVLQERQAMHAQDLQGLSVEEARLVPTLSQAAQAIPNVQGLPAPTTEVPQAQQLVASGAAGALVARLYRPALAKNTPVILYFVGGTWVTGTLDEYDETARQLAARTGWVVVSLQTRLAPETRFPGAHEDALALYQWARANLRSWGADPTRVVLAGEGPGANLALSVAMVARDKAAAGSPLATPDQLLLVTPWAGTALDTPSMRENRRAEPLQRATVDWAQELYARHHLDDKRIDLAARQDFAVLPPTTVVLAEIDPTRSGGEALAAKMQAAGVKVEERLVPGVTAGFFGLGQTVPEAAAAEDWVADRLRSGFVAMALPELAAPRPDPVRRVRARARVRAR